jgi:hypothetical protein
MRIWFFLFTATFKILIILYFINSLTSIHNTLLLNVTLIHIFNKLIHWSSLTIGIYRRRECAWCNLFLFSYFLHKFTSFISWFNSQNVIIEKWRHLIRKLGESLFFGFPYFLNFFKTSRKSLSCWLLLINIFLFT